MGKNFDLSSLWGSTRSEYQPCEDSGLLHTQGGLGGYHDRSTSGDYGGGRGQDDFGQGGGRGQDSSSGFGNEGGFQQEGRILMTGGITGMSQAGQNHLLRRNLKVRKPS